MLGCVSSIETQLSREVPNKDKTKRSRKRSANTQHNVYKNLRHPQQVSTWLLVFGGDLCIIACMKRKFGSH